MFNLFLFIVFVLLMMGTGMSFASAALTALVGMLTGYSLYLLAR